MTERDAAVKLESVCYCFGNSRERKNRLAQAIGEYIQAVAQNGLDRQNGYFNCTNLKKTFGIEFNDSPAVRYNKITTYRL